MLCSDRPEGFGPMSHLYSHVVTSCFVDTILIPLCTWLYLLTIFLLFFMSSRARQRAHQSSSKFDMVSGFGSHKKVPESNVEEGNTFNTRRRHGKLRIAISTLYYLLLVAQLLMCVLEITRLELAHLGIGLLPFTFVSIIAAGVLRLTRGLQDRIRGYRWASLGLWIALAIMNAVKIAEETKEGINGRKGSKYMIVDEVTDVSVMIGVYAALGVLEICLKP